MLAVSKHIVLKFTINRW